MNEEYDLEGEELDLLPYEDPPEDGIDRHYEGLQDYREEDEDYA